MLKAVTDSSHVPGAERWPNRGRARLTVPGPARRHHLITGAHGVPLTVSLTGGNRNDVTQLMPPIQAIQPVRGRRGRRGRPRPAPAGPGRRPDAVYADRL
jgi:hypothetical protein